MTFHFKPPTAAQWRYVCCFVLMIGKAMAAELVLDTSNQFNAPHETAERKFIGLVQKEHGNLHFVVLRTPQGIKFFAFNIGVVKSKLLHRLFPLDNPTEGVLETDGKRLSNEIRQNTLVILGQVDASSSNYAPESFAPFAKWADGLRGDGHLSNVKQVNFKAGFSDYSLYISDPSELSPRIQKIAAAGCVGAIWKNCLNLPSVVTLVSRNRTISFTIVAPRNEVDISDVRESTKGEMEVYAFEAINVPDIGISDKSIVFDLSSTIASLPLDVADSSLEHCAMIVPAKTYIKFLEKALPVELGKGFKQFSSDRDKLKRKIEDSLIKFEKNRSRNFSSDCKFKQWP
jgi:hypothetical protein